MQFKSKSKYQIMAKSQTCRFLMLLRSPKLFQNLPTLNKINILDTFYCPHSPEDNCLCRKPKPGMLLKAQKKHAIDMSNSWLIGDKEDDISAANSSGIFNTILVRSGHKIDESRSKAKYFLDSIHESISVVYD